MDAKRRSDRGFVTAEFAFGVGVLLLPVIVLALSFPVWVERQSVARTAAQEAAREAVLAPSVATATGSGVAVVEEIAANFDLEPDDVSVCFATHAVDAEPGTCSRAVAGLPRGGAITARVSVTLPALNFPLIGSTLEAASYTASHTERVDTFRSFRP